MKDKKTDTLMSVLQQASSESLPEFFDTYADWMTKDEKPFSTYMRTIFKEKGLRQQNVFLEADISEGYGYKLIAEEKHTIQRDVILRLCLGARFSLEETQGALRLYGMAMLYPRIPRDAVLIVAINTGVYEMAAVDRMLHKQNMEALYACNGPE